MLPSHLDTPLQIQSYCLTLIILMENYSTLNAALCISCREAEEDFRRFRHPVGVFTHQTGAGLFCLKFNSFYFNGDRPVGHRTVPEKHQELLKILKQIGQCWSGHRTIPLRTAINGLWVSLPPIEKRRVFSAHSTHSIHIQVIYFSHFTSASHGQYTKIIISFEELMMDGMQRTKTTATAAIWSECGFHLHHCQNLSLSFLTTIFFEGMMANKDLNEYTIAHGKSAGHCISYFNIKHTTSVD